jgi:hypothetical protein
MNRVIAYLIRFAVIILGYAVASLAASAFLNVVFLGSAGFSAEEAPMVATGSLIFSIPFVALFVAYFAFIPSAFAILAGEIFAKRDWLFYAIAGGVVAAIVIGFIPGAAEAGNEAVTDPSFALALIGGGMCGGLGYWLVAGRTAGSWWPAPEPARGAGDPGT